MFKSEYLKGVVPKLKDLTPQKGRQRNINYIIRKNKLKTC